MKIRLLWLLLGLAPAARAQAPQDRPPSARAQAKLAYERGVELFKAKQFREAVVEFNKAYRVDPSPVLLYNIARAFEELHEYGSAIDFYRQYLASGKANDRAQVEQTIRTLELVQKDEPVEQTRYTLDSRPSGAEVRMGGELVGSTPVTLTVARGAYTFEISKPGHAPQTVERTLATAEQAETLTLAPLALEPRVAAEAGAPIDGDGLRAEAAPTSARSTWGWVAVGVGGALVAGAVFTGLEAQTYADRLDEIDADPEAFTRADFKDAQSSGRTWGITTDVLWGVGAASIGAGVWLLLTDDAEATAGWTPFNAGVAYQGRF